VNTDLKSGLTLTVALESGDWTLEVKGYSGHTDESIGSLVVRGTSSITITAGISSPVTVYLTPDFSSGGTGTLSYSIGFPPTVSQAFLGLYPLQAQGTGQEIAISANALVTIDLPAGSYQAFIDLYDGTYNKAVIWTGVVHIYDGSDTPLDQQFTAANFAGPKVVGEGETTLAAKLDTALLSPRGAYTIILDGTETDLPSFTPKTLSVTSDKVIAITIEGNGQTVQVGTTGTPLFTLIGCLSLTIQDLTLKGRSGNSVPVVKVNSGGTLEMKTGSLITGNTTDQGGGGVVVTSGGTLNMIDGAVSGNTSNFTSNGGGGVLVNGGGKFTMSGGAVSNNYGPNGGGLFVGGEFTMSGGVVSGNRSGQGGGVFVHSYNGSLGAFSMSGGVIYGSDAENSSKANKATGGKSAAIYNSGGTVDPDDLVTEGMRDMTTP
jgi:hypothetical protein